MKALLLSANHQVVIPRAIREAMGLTPGMPMQVLQYGDRIELIPVRPMATSRGSCRGMDTRFVRDSDR